VDDGSDWSDEEAQDRVQVAVQASRVQVRSEVRMEDRAGWKPVPEKMALGDRRARMVGGVPVVLEFGDGEYKFEVLDEGRMVGRGQNYG
jgi:hypothetical protein